MLAKNRAEIDALDENRRTPLHYASESGKVKVIPILLQYGANVKLKDGKKKLTALQLAASQRVREIIIVHTESKYKAKAEDIQYLSGLKGEKMPIRVEEQVVMEPEKDEEYSEEILVHEEPLYEEIKQDLNLPIPNDLKNHRDTLINLLLRIQEYGVTSYQHIKNPHLFSGSWMEYVHSVDDLIKCFDGINSSNAVIRVFNVLFPYLKVMPGEKGDEVAASEFYGEGQIEEMVFKSPKKKYEEKNITDLEAKLKESEERVKSLQKELKSKVEIVNEVEKDTELLKERKEKEILEKRVKELEEMLNKPQIRVKREEIIGAKGPLAVQLEQAKNRILELEKQLEAQRQIDKALRVKAGQMFLESIEETKEGYTDISNEYNNFNPIDDYALIRLLSKFDDNPLELQEVLIKADIMNNGTLTISQYSRILEDLQVPPQDIISILRLTNAFENESHTFNIEEYITHISNRAELRKRWEEELFRRVAKYFKENKISLTDAFGFFDSNKNGQIEFEEMASAFSAMKIKLPRKDIKAVFAVLDKDMNGNISLEEFEARLLDFNEVDFDEGVVKQEDEKLIEEEHKNQEQEDVEDQNESANNEMQELNKTENNQEENNSNLREDIIDQQNTSQPKNNDEEQEEYNKEEEYKNEEEEHKNEEDQEEEEEYKKERRMTDAENPLLLDSLKPEVKEQPNDLKDSLTQLD